MAEDGQVRSKTSHRTPGQILRHGRTYQARPEQRKNRAKRNAARKRLGLKKGDPRDAGHVEGIHSNKVVAQSRHVNRGHGKSGNGRVKRGQG